MRGRASSSHSLRASPRCGRVCMDRRLLLQRFRTEPPLPPELRHTAHPHSPLTGGAAAVGLESGLAAVAAAGMRTPPRARRHRVWRGDSTSVGTATSSPSPGVWAHHDDGVLTRALAVIEQSRHAFGTRMPSAAVAEGTPSRVTAATVPAPPLTACDAPRVVKPIREHDLVRSHGVTSPGKYFNKPCQGNDAWGATHHHSTAHQRQQLPLPPHLPPSLLPQPLPLPLAWRLRPHPHLHLQSPPLRRSQLCLRGWLGLLRCPTASLRSQSRVLACEWPEAGRGTWPPPPRTLQTSLRRGSGGFGGAAFRMVPACGYDGAPTSAQHTARTVAIFVDVDGGECGCQIVFQSCLWATLRHSRHGVRYSMRSERPHQS